MLTQQPSGLGGARPRQSGDPDYIMGDGLGFAPGSELAFDDGLDPDDDDEDDEDEEFWADDMLGEARLSLSAGAG